MSAYRGIVFFVIVKIAALFLMRMFFAHGAKQALENMNEESRARYEAMLKSM